jgi:hypothetical protein
VCVIRLRSEFVIPKGLVDVSIHINRKLKLIRYDSDDEPRGN